jgi:hypothetical protein
VVLAEKSGSRLRKPGCVVVMSSRSRPTAVLRPLSRRKKCARDATPLPHAFLYRTLLPRLHKICRIAFSERPGIPPRSPCRGRRACVSTAGNSTNARYSLPRLPSSPLQTIIASVMCSWIGLVTESASTDGLPAVEPWPVQRSSPGTR